MSDEVWIFVSYAHDDDLQLSASKDEKGFVTFFCEMLRAKLRDLGATRARVWLDRQRVSDGDQFDGKIDDGLSKAQILLVVMSNNWLSRPYCRKELDEFVELRRAAGVDNVSERMVVVGKGHVDRLRRPPLLQTQEGFLFYARDDQNDVADVKAFFNRGDACDDRFYDRRDDLAAFLQRRVDRIAEGAGTGTVAAPGQPIASPNGRTVYLAKPAADMEGAYSRLAFELQGKGYNVVPEVNSDVPKSAAVRDYVNTALEKAEVSIHLVGEKRGSFLRTSSIRSSSCSSPWRASGPTEARARRSPRFAGSSGRPRFWTSRTSRPAPRASARTNSSCGGQPGKPACRIGGKEARGGAQDASRNEGSERPEIPAARLRLKRSRPFGPAAIFVPCLLDHRIARASVGVRFGRPLERLYRTRLIAPAAPFTSPPSAPGPPPLSCASSKFVRTSARSAR